MSTSIISEAATAFGEAAATAEGRRVIAGHDEDYQFDLVDGPDFFVSINAGGVTVHPGRTSKLGYFESTFITTDSRTLGDLFAGRLGPVEAIEQRRFTMLIRMYEGAQVTILLRIAGELARRRLVNGSPQHAVDRVQSDRMYGWRGRIAHLAPSRGDVLVHEFYRIAPPGTMLINTTGTIRRLEKDDIEARFQQLEAAAKDVANEHVDLIIAGGGPLFTSRAPGSAEQLATRLSEVCNVPCVMSIQLEVEALAALGCRRPVIASPYPEELNGQLVSFLTGAGFDVQGATGLGIVSNSDIGRLAESAAVDCGREAAANAVDADVVFMPCARWPTLRAIQILEAELGLPVVSATTADFYGAFRRLDIRDPIVGHGRLLYSLSQVATGAAGAAARKGADAT